MKEGGGGGAEADAAAAAIFFAYRMRFLRPSRPIVVLVLVSVLVVVVAAAVDPFGTHKDKGEHLPPAFMGVYSGRAVGTFLSYAVRDYASAFLLWEHGSVRSTMYSRTPASILRVKYDCHNEQYPGTQKPSPPAC